MKKIKWIVSLSIAMGVLFTTPQANAEDAFASDSVAAPYYRFWRGWKKPELDYRPFAADLSSIFVPSTVKNGAGLGLIAYLPALPPQEKPAGVPDEIALVVYRDLKSYQAIGATPAGQAYTASHWNYFDRSKSASTVPGPYAGTIALDQAYDLAPHFVDWQQGSSSIAVYLRGTGLEDADYLKAVKQVLDRASEKLSSSEPDSGGAKGLLVLVGTDSLVVYQNGESETPLFAPSDPRIPLFVQYPLRKQNQGSTRLLPGTGIDVQFTP